MKQLVEKIIRTSLILTISFSCKEPTINNTHHPSTTVVQKINEVSLLSKLNDNLLFIGDSLFTGKAVLIKELVSKYQHDTCGFIAYKDSVLKAGFEGVKIVGDINGNKSNDTVFVLPSFNYCDEGDSYYFFDTSLPRLYTDSYCCRPDNLFPIGDIDEDGISEICIFYSSCASRFKSLIAYSLKKKTWKAIGRCTFDIEFVEADKEKRVRKMGKGKFEMLEIVDKEENKKWKRFSF
ncbi:hypothetical protein ACQKLP_11040 [Chitinophaga sp. NPDC101104]|uniref:hypothetical protein n=1 Tax=Chitinophaga sp. NPDC101104 TaxID=3390561 RepID=UPI003D05C35A